MDFSEDETTTTPRPRKSLSPTFRRLSEMWEEQDKKEKSRTSSSRSDQRSHSRFSSDSSTQRSPEKRIEFSTSPDEQTVREKISLKENMRDHDIATAHFAKNIETIGFQALAGDENGMLFFKSREVQQEMRDSLTPEQKHNLVETFSEKVEELYQDDKLQNQRNSMNYAFDEMLTNEERKKLIRDGNEDVAKKIATIRKTISEIVQPLCNEHQRIIETFDRTPDKLLLNFIDFSDFPFDPTRSISDTMAELISVQKLEVPKYQDNDLATQKPDTLLGKRLFDQQLKNTIINFYAKEYASKIPFESTIQEIERLIPDFTRFTPELKSAIIIRNRLISSSEGSAAPL